jgi:hypothetical protein
MFLASDLMTVDYKAETRKNKRFCIRKHYYLCCAHKQMQRMET